MIHYSYILSYWIWGFAFCFVVAMLNNYRYCPAPVILSSMAWILLTIGLILLPILNLPLRIGVSTFPFRFRLYITGVEILVSMIVLCVYLTYSKLSLKQNAYYELLYLGIYLIWLYLNNTNPIQIYVYDMPNEAPHYVHMLSST